MEVGAGARHRPTIKDRLQLKWGELRATHRFGVFLRYDLLAPNGFLKASV